MVDAVFENQKELTKMQLYNQKDIAEMRNETQRQIAGIHSSTSRKNTKVQVYAQNDMLAYHFFFFNDPAPPDIYPLPLPDPLPIFVAEARRPRPDEHEPVAQDADVGGPLHDVHERDDGEGALAAARGAARVVHAEAVQVVDGDAADRKSTRLNSSHLVISYAVFCLK